MTIEEAISYLERCADGLDPCFDNAVSLAVAALQTQQTQQKERSWHRYSEEKPTVEKDYCTIRQFHSQGVTGIETVKDGEIWVEMDYWSKRSEWTGWESIGPDNLFWETLYWVDLGRTEILLPDDLPGPVTRSFGEEVSRDS